MKFLIVFISLLFLVLGFQNCSPEHKASEQASLGEYVYVESEAKSIIVNKCMGCHGPGAQTELTPDVQALAEAGHVVAGEPQNSNLYLKLIDRIEPPADSGITLTDSEIETIRKWIKGPTSLNYVEHIRPILQACHSCHNNNGRRLNTYADLMRNDRIVPGDLEASNLWLRVTTDDEEQKMPPNNMPGLKADELQILSEWILSGAQEFE